MVPCGAVWCSVVQCGAVSAVLLMLDDVLVAFELEPDTIVWTIPRLHIRTNTTKTVRQLCDPSIFYINNIDIIILKREGRKRNK